MCIYQTTPEATLAASLQPQSFSYYQLKLQISLTGKLPFSSKESAVSKNVDR